MALTWQEAQNKGLYNLMNAKSRLFRSSSLAASVQEDLAEIAADAQTDLDDIGEIADKTVNVSSALENRLSSRVTELTNIESGNLKDGAPVI